MLTSESVRNRLATASTLANTLFNSSAAAMTLCWSVTTKSTLVVHTVER